MTGKFKKAAGDVFDIGRGNLQSTKHVQKVRVLKLSEMEGFLRHVEVYNEVKTAYGDKVTNCMSVFKWCCEFKNDHRSVHDDQRSG